MYNLKGICFLFVSDSLVITSVVQCIHMVMVGSSPASGVKEVGVMLWWIMFLFILGEAITATFLTLLV